MNKGTLIELDGYYTPVNAPAYWCQLIGRVKGVIRMEKNVPVYRVEFSHRLNGTKLPKTDTFDFPASKLKAVKNFASLVKKHTPKPVKVEQDEYEEIVEGSISPEVAKWQEKSQCKDALYVLQSSLGKPNVVLCSTPEGLSVPNLNDKLIRAAINIPEARIFAVGPHFSHHDVPDNWITESKDNGHYCIILKNTVKRWSYFILLDSNSNNRMKVL